MIGRYQPEQASKLDAAAAQQPGYVAKTNADAVFRYHIARADGADEAVEEAPTQQDFVLGVRPEFVHISDQGPIAGEIFSAMPTGMETTVKVRVGEYLLTAVVFGGVTYKIGQQVRLGFSGNGVMLFSRQNGRMITLGSLSVG